MTAGVNPVPQDDEGAASPSPTDEALVARYLGAPRSESGRKAAELLFSRYDARTYHWCLRLARNHDTALDLAQEAVLTALRDLGQFQGHSRFSTWLYTVVRRRALRLLQRERRWLTDEEATEHLVSGAPGPADIVASQDEEAWLRQVMREVLEPDEAKALILRCEEGMPVEEVTRLLGLTSASGARGLLQSARRKLRSTLERRRKTEGDVR